VKSLLDDGLKMAITFVVDRHLGSLGLDDLSAVRSLASNRRGGVSCFALRRASLPALVVSRTCSSDCVYRSVL